MHLWLTICLATLLITTANLAVADDWLTDILASPHGESVP